MMGRRIASGLLLLLLVVACHRNVEPYDPNEAVVEPDLSAIFPEGAERANAAAESPRAMMPMGARGGSARGAPVTGQIVLAAEFEGRVPAGAVLFLIARTEGVGPPVAVKRITDPRFPMAFELGPDDMHEMPFTGPFQLTARVDSDANAATRTDGDLQGSAQGTYAPGATGVTIVIDELL